MVDAVRLTDGAEEVLITPPCPSEESPVIDQPIALRALTEGLRVHFTVRDPSWVPGPMRDVRCDRYDQGDHPRQCQRDVVVLYPNTAVPGAPTIELDATPRPGGFAVDQILPWSLWNLERGLDRFRLRISLFNRGPSGVETELRISVMVFRIHPETPSENADRNRGRS